MPSGYGIYGTGTSDIPAKDASSAEMDQYDGQPYKKRTGHFELNILGRGLYFGPKTTFIPPPL